MGRYERAGACGTVDEIKAAGHRVVPVGNVTVLVMFHEGEFHAVDNRCPHMGFPLHRGDIQAGLLDCHWHHARFDITSGATLDPWADDVDCYRVYVEAGAVFVDPNRPARDPRAHGLQRLERGLNENIRLVVAKSAVELEAGGVPASEAVAIGARFGAKEHEQGWRSGLTILSAMANVLDDLAPEDRARGLTKSLAWIATECEGQPPRRPLPGLHETRRGPAGLRTWLRETIEVRDADGAERILRTLAEDHGPRAALDAVLACCTDHRYCDGGHTLDFAVKCAELAEFLNSDGDAALMFTALVPQLVSMARLEETSAWRRPVDIAALVADAERELPVAPFEDVGDAPPLADEEALVGVLLGEEPARTLEEILRRLGESAAPVALADAVTTAATRRILRFGTVNEVPDWDTVHHTQTYANAVARDCGGPAAVSCFAASSTAPCPSTSTAFSTCRPHGYRSRWQRRRRTRWRRCSTSTTGARRWTRSRWSHARSSRAAAIRASSSARWDTRLCARTRGSTTTSRSTSPGSGSGAAQEQTYTIALRLHRGESLYA